MRAGKSVILEAQYSAIRKYLCDLASFFCCFLIKYEIPELFVGGCSFG